MRQPFPFLWLIFLFFLIFSIAQRSADNGTFGVSAHDARIPVTWRTFAPFTNWHMRTVISFKVECSLFNPLTFAFVSSDAERVCMRTTKATVQFATKFHFNIQNVVYKIYKPKCFSSFWRFYCALITQVARDCHWWKEEGRVRKAKRNSQIIIIDCNKDRSSPLIMQPQRPFDSTSRHFSSFATHFVSSDRIAANGQVQVTPLVRLFYNHKQVREKNTTSSLVSISIALVFFIHYFI